MRLDGYRSVQVVYKLHLTYISEQCETFWCNETMINENRHSQGGISMLFSFMFNIITSY